MGAKRAVSRTRAQVACLAVLVALLVVLTGCASAGDTAPSGSAAATDAASEQPAPTVTIQPASATSVPQRPHKGGLLSGVLGALFKKGPRR